MPFNFSQHWTFPSNNGGQISGIADSGIETFNGSPIKSLAREICQNSLDAAASPDVPVHIAFKRFEIEPSQVPDCPTLEDAHKRAKEFWSVQNSEKARAFFKAALSTINAPRIPCLRISDFNTTGLIGSRKEYNSPWCNLTKSQGASDKSGNNGGSFGIGKFAPFACSALRTVIYSTSDIEGTCAYQGVSRLTSFKDKNNEITQGVGFYGNANNSPVFDSQYSLDPGFTRDSTEHGTDIFILGFNGDEEWKSQMVASVLDGFLYAVYCGTLTVDVDGVLIDRKTLPELIKDYKPYFREHADEYYQALTDEKLSKPFEKEISEEPDISGKLKLKMLIKPGFHRRVAMIRQTRMKIKDKGNINSLIPFAGVLYIEGNAINSYLRSLENPQHLDWEIERADNKAKAKRILKSLLAFIKTSLDEMKNDDSAEAIDPSVGEYLPATPEGSAENQETHEALTDDILDFKTRVIEAVPKPSNSPANQSGQSIGDDEEGGISTVYGPGDRGSGGKNPDHGGGQGGGHNPGVGSGDAPVEHRKAVSPVPPLSVRFIVRNKDAGDYAVIFTPALSAANAYLDIFMAAESQNYEAPILSADCPGCPQSTVRGNRISNLAFTAKKALRIDLKLDYHDYCSLEVRAYGNKT